MRRIALVLLIVATVAAEETEQSQVLGSVKLYNANGSHLVGAINFLQTGKNMESFIALGHLWGVDAGKYIGIVYERASSQAGKYCTSIGPVVMERDNHIKARRPMTLFIEKLNDETEYRFISVDEGASLKAGARNDIMNRTVVIYRVTPADLGLCFVTREKVAKPIACGVVVPGPVQPGAPKIPDFMEDETRMIYLRTLKIN